MNGEVQGILEIQDAAGMTTHITLSGDSGEIDVGGAGANGSIVLQDGQGKPRIRIGRALVGKTPRGSPSSGSPSRSPRRARRRAGHRRPPTRNRLSRRIHCRQVRQLGTALGATHTGQGVGVRGTATYHAGSGVGGRNTANACLGVLGMGGSSQFLATGVYRRTGELEGGFGWAGYFDGDVMVGGDLYGGGKYCKIDHPLDPKNKYLIHACVESSERLNIYRGSVKLSTRGEATIRLPKWIQAFNSEFEYQLTPIGAAAPDLHVAKEIIDNRFKIAGGPPGIRVSWQVSGVRADAYAIQHPMRVDVSKRAAERGTFLHPVEHGCARDLPI